MRYGFYLPTRGRTATRDGRGSQRCARANGGNGIGSGSAPHYTVYHLQRKQLDHADQRSSD